MKFTQYLSMVIKYEGVPNLDNEQFGKLMNLVHLEGCITALEKMKKIEPNPDLRFKYDIPLMGYNDKIETLTEGVPPEQFLQHLIS